MINEKIEESIGIARNMHENKSIDKPAKITGLRPILSDMKPVIGEKII